ncbi:MAG: hypothetical protein COA63_000665 [Methylophaga sp.]|nr:hypothetical protein [Methylophaga sp.]
MMTTIAPSHAVLAEWNILINVTDGTENFVGYDENIMLGRMSTAIIKFNEEKGEGRTFSGSTYKTQGAAGKLHADALYVIEHVLAGRNIEYEWKYPVQGVKGE